MDSKTLMFKHTLTTLAIFSSIIVKSIEIQIVIGKQ